MTSRKVTRARKMPSIRPLVCCLIVLCSLCSTAAAENTGENRPGGRFNVGYRILDLKYRSGEKEKTISVAVWYPTASPAKPYIYGGPTGGNVAVDAAPYGERGPYPLLVFSHGFGGSGLGSVFLTEALAARGWIVAAPDHHDRYPVVRIRTGVDKDFDRIGFLREVGTITASGPEDRGAYLYRLEEMKAVLDGMLASKEFGALIDRAGIAVGGHSFGGFTALGLCGTIDRWRDDRIRAVLLFSTGAGGYLFREQELAAIKIPLMYLLGEREKDQPRGNKTMTQLADKVFQQASPPKYLLEIKGANHFSFNNRFVENKRAHLLGGSEEQFEVIRRYAIAFLERHVAGKREAGEVLDRHDPLLTRYLREPAVKE